MLSFNRLFNRGSQYAIPDTDVNGDGDILFGFPSFWKDVRTQGNVYLKPKSKVASILILA